MGDYEPKVNTVLQKAPAFSPSRADRFTWLGPTKEAHIPLAYAADISTKLRRHGVSSHTHTVRVGQVPQMQPVHRGPRRLAWPRGLRL